MQVKRAESKLLVRDFSPYSCLQSKSLNGRGGGAPLVKVNKMKYMVGDFDSF